MAEYSGHAAGEPSWVDIGTDLGPAKSFYGKVFGWEGRDAGPVEQTGGYGFFTLKGKMIAGYGPQQNPGPPAWVVYFATDDADATAKAVTTAGGKVVQEPMDVMSEGRMAMFSDPEGAMFGVWQERNNKGVELAHEDGALIWVELTSRDTAGARNFYPEVFGWDANILEGEMQYTELKLGGNPVAGMIGMPSEMPAEVAPYWMPYFGTSNVDASADTAKSAGASSVAGPADIPGGGRFAVLHDPQGALFGLFQAPSA